MKSFRKKAIAAAAALCAMTSPGLSKASTLITFPLSNGGSGNSAGRVYAITVGTITVKVRVTAWSMAGTSGNNSIQRGAVQSYSNGLGVSSIGEATSSPHHTIDNLTNRDFLIFQFDQPVSLERARFTTYNMGSSRTDGDATIGFATGSGNWMQDPLASSATYAQFAALFGNNFEASNVGSTSGTTAGTRSLNGLNNVGNIWLIGAGLSNPTEDCGRWKNQNCVDGFKLSQVTVQAVPEPSTWVLLLLGFGFVGYSMRRRRREDERAAVC